MMKTKWGSPTNQYPCFTQAICSYYSDLLDWKKKEIYLTIWIENDLPPTIELEQVCLKIIYSTVKHYFASYLRQRISCLDVLDSKVLVINLDSFKVHSLISVHYFLFCLPFLNQIIQFNKFGIVEKISQSTLVSKKNSKVLKNEDEKWRRKRWTFYPFKL